MLSAFFAIADNWWESEDEIAAELSKLLHFEGDLHDLCHLAHSLRKSESFAFLTAKVTAIAGTSEGTHLDGNDFVKSQHYIGRLGSHVTAAKTLVDTARQLPSLFDEFEIKTLPCEAIARRQIDGADHVLDAVLAATISG